MARATTVWEIPKNTTEPKRLPEGTIDLEKTLEDWVEKHPDLVEPGLTVLARQLSTDGGPLDLLCLDADGRLVIVELKRADAYRVALAQVFDYAACVAALSYDVLKQQVDKNRKDRGDAGTLDELLKNVLGDAAQDWTPDATEPRLVLVGTGADESLRRIVDYMTAKYDVPVNGVFFDVSISASGSTLLVRSAVVADEQAAQQGRRRGRGGLTHEELIGLAKERGVADFVTPVLDAWREGTGRAGRPERRFQYWSLASKSNGTSVAARLYPYNGNTYSEDAVKTAWLKLELAKLAGDLQLDDAGLKKSFSDSSVVISDDGRIELSTEAHAKAVVAWIQKAFPVPVAAQNA